jgi:L-methionine (R)-S-oxide reductase
MTSSPSILLQVKSLIEDEPNFIANLSNVSALLWEHMRRHIPSINWLGFYLAMRSKQNENENENENEKEEPSGLVLGPFQGKVACVRIRWGRGVCGTAASQRCIQRVADVNRFKDHIACDSDSKSELVVPIIANDIVYGVLDIDSTEFDSFSESDELWLQGVCHVLALQLNWPQEWQ